MRCRLMLVKDEPNGQWQALRLEVRKNEEALGSKIQFCTFMKSALQKMGLDGATLQPPGSNWYNRPARLLLDEQPMLALCASMKGLVDSAP